MLTYGITTTFFMSLFLSKVDQVSGEIVGVSGDVLSTLARALNFTISFVPYVESGPWKEKAAKYHGAGIGFTYLNDVDLFLGETSSPLSKGSTCR